MTKHLDKNISDISYNFLNLPNQITQTTNTSYVYRADGLKLKKSYGGKKTDYLDGFQYENDVLQFVPTAEGYYDFNLKDYIYNFTDHLGNVRLSYSDKDKNGIIDVNVERSNSVCFQSGTLPNGIPIMECTQDIYNYTEILEENNYYPFGLKFVNENLGTKATPSYNYKYNGKELQETGMYDYGARFYMPDIGRWGVHDPLSELQFKYSPYAYTYNNPILFNDPTGMIGECPNGNCPPEFINGGKAKEIDEVVITKVTPMKNSLSWLGISNMNNYYANRSHLADAINNCAGCRDMERYEGYVMSGMVGMALGGPLGAVEGISGDAIMDNLSPAMQAKVADAQMLAILIVILRKGKGFQNIGDDVAETALQKAKRLGKEGEDAAGITGPKRKITINGRTRYPDELTTTTLKEVKNVNYQGFTKQLRDYLEYAKENKLDMILQTRPDIKKISKPLQKAIDNGDIEHIFLK